MQIFLQDIENICGKTYPVLPQIRVRICGNKFTKYRKYFQELAVKRTIKCLQAKI